MRIRKQFAVGILVGVALSVAGGVVYYLLRRKSPTAPLEGIAIQSLPRLTLPNPPAIVAPPKQPSVDEDLFHPPAPVPKRRANTTIRSYTLPGPGQDAVRLVSSGDAPYTVMVRVVDPPGAFAMFSFDASVLNNGVAVPTGENVIIPVGQWQTITLPPKSALYGRGSAAGVTASVTGSSH